MDGENIKVAQGLSEGRQTLTADPQLAENSYSILRENGLQPKGLLSGICVAEPHHQMGDSTAGLKELWKLSVADR